jgi:hypothetical protein
MFTVSRTLLVSYRRRRIDRGQSAALVFRQQQGNKGDGIFMGLASLGAGIASRGLTPTIRIALHIETPSTAKMEPAEFRLQ